MTLAPLRIGFVDHQLENFHANVFLRAIREDLKQHNAVVAGCWCMESSIGQAWASKNNVPWHASAKALAGDVDALMVLAPSNPELHLPLVRKVVAAGKPIYLDKPSAQNVKTLERIFALADQHGATLQTSSALRYTAVQKQVAQAGSGALRHIVTWGGGSSFEEYGIHPTELAVSCMGDEVHSLMRRSEGNFWQLLVNFSQGRTATIHTCVGIATPFSCTLVTQKQTQHITPDTSRLFIDAADAILTFLRSGQPNIPRAQSLAVRRILDGAARPASLKKFIRI